VIIPVVNHNDRRITVTPADIVHQRRLAAVTHAIEIGNVAEAARRHGVSRKSLHSWKVRFEAYGSEALRPKAQRRPAPSNATPDHVISKLAQLAVTDPGGGARSYAAALSDDDYRISKSCVQSHLNRLGLGSRSQRFAAAAQLALFTQGLVAPDALEARKEGPFGFSHWAPAPGVWVQLDCFYIGKLKGVGEIWQLTATDVRTRIADVLIISGRPTSQATARFLDLLRRRWTRRGFPLRGVITDNGGEFKAVFAVRVDQLGLEHRRIPARSPNHNAVVERFHQTMLERCWRPAFHQRFFTSIRQLQAQANSWLVTYADQPNHGDWMRGTSPNQQLSKDRPE
jgi:transposase InsO family protein/transposase